MKIRSTLLHVTSILLIVTSTLLEVRSLLLQIPSSEREQQGGEIHILGIDG